MDSILLHHYTVLLALFGFSMKKTTVGMKLKFGVKFVSHF